MCLVENHCDDLLGHAAGLLARSLEAGLACLLKPDRVLVLVLVLVLGHGLLVLALAPAPGHALLTKRVEMPIQMQAQALGRYLVNVPTLTLALALVHGQAQAHVPVKVRGHDQAQAQAQAQAPERAQALVLGLMQAQYSEQLRDLLVWGLPVRSCVASPQRPGPCGLAYRGPRLSIAELYFLAQQWVN